jgi:hypothetical protein
VVEVGLQLHETAVHSHESGVDGTEVSVDSIFRVLQAYPEAERSTAQEENSDTNGHDLAQ